MKSRLFTRHFECLLIVSFCGFTAGCRESSLPDIEYRPKVSQPIQPKSPDEYPTKWKGKGVTTIGSGIHVLNNLTPSSVYAIETNAGVILIDTGKEEPVGHIRQGLLQVNLRVEKVKHVLITHAHYDHVLGVNDLKAATNADVHIGKDDADVLRNGDADALFSVFPRVPYSGKPIAVDHELSDGDVIELGDTKIEVIATPGHTPGSCCFLLERDDTSYLFAGDVIASLNFGPATYSINLPDRYRGDAATYVASLDRLLAMPVPDRVLPGHPHQHRNLESIRMDQKQWEKLLRPARDYAAKTVERHKNDGRDFLGESPFSVEKDVFYLGKLEGIGIYAFRFNDEIAIINTAGGDGYWDWVEQKLAELDIPQSPSSVFLTVATPSTAASIDSLPKNISVVAAPADVKTLSQDTDANLVESNDLAELGFSMSTVELGTEVAYVADINGKRVLCTPNQPRQVDLVWKNDRNGHTSYGALFPAQPEWEQEIREIEAVRFGAIDIFAVLGEQEPDIWLPLVPELEQNANLYDKQWDDIIRANRRVAPSRL